MPGRTVYHDARQASSCEPVRARRARLARRDPRTPASPRASAIHPGVTGELAATWDEPVQVFFVGSAHSLV
jgi:hypothetical protein